MARAPTNQPGPTAVNDVPQQASDPQPDDSTDHSTPTDLASASPFIDTLPAQPQSANDASSDIYTVTARNGLHLRAGPGTQFSILKLLPFGTPVNLLKREGDWALVDQIGDGAADGHLLAAYLKQGAPDNVSMPLVAALAAPNDFRILDVATLQTIMTRCGGMTIKSKLDLNEVVYALNKAMTLAGAVTKLREVAFLSQAVIETDYFRTYEEYGEGKGKSYFPFYGRGLHQLTWRETYKACSSAVFQDDRLINDPDLIIKDIEVNIKATAWYWRDNKPFNKLADNRDIDSIIHLLYGGTINSPNPNVRKSVLLRRSFYTTIGTILA